jgi:sensor histidine kinase YesM
MVALTGLTGWGVYAFIRNRMAQRRREEHLTYRAERLQLEHQALYAMMNPHFTFNALQSIQYYIHRQDRIAANKFLSNFAKLMRKNLDSINSEYITLAEEIERLELYLSLEKMRFQDKFEFHIEVDDDLRTHDLKVPPMILQPYVENSIKHGIMSLEEGGEITVSIAERDEDHLLVGIRDNGIGITASKSRRDNRPSDHVSRGMKITEDRLALFATVTGKEYSLNIKEVWNDDGTSAGTLVEMVLPQMGG